VAGAAGEVAKDEKHLAMVEKAKNDFIPLLVECFGVWTPFALLILHSITDRMTTRNGISHKVTRMNLLQQISVCLWTNNTRIILRYWALQSDDPSPIIVFDFVVVVC